MAADTQLLQGEVVENPGSQKVDIEGLLADFLRALLVEQGEQNVLIDAPSNGVHS